MDFKINTEDVPYMGMIGLPDKNKPKKIFEDLPDFDLDGDVEDNVAYLYNELCFLPKKIEYE